MKIVEEILVLTKAKIPDGTEELLVESAIREAEAKIKNFCNLRDVPPGLFYVWANLAADLVRYYLGVKALDAAQIGDTEDIGADTLVGQLKKVTAGKISLEFGGKTAWDTVWARGPGTSKVSGVEAFLFNYMSDLLAYRRVKWW